MLLTKARGMVAEAKRKNKTSQEVERIKIQLTMVEKNLGLKSLFWGANEIFAFLLVLEINPRTGDKIVIESLERKFGLVKTIFENQGYPMDPVEERKVRMALNMHYKQRLDEAENPTKDKSAPMLAPTDWVKIQKWLMDTKFTTKAFQNKKYMAMLSIAFGFSTGLRLTEIHRLKYSDLDLNGDDEIKLRIRRSKSNRRGSKKVWQVAPAYEAEPLLCPVQILMLYVERMNKTMAPGAFIFSDDEMGTKLTRVENLTNYWRMGAEGAGLDEDKWPAAHSHHNSKINMARALGYSDIEITDAMNWSSTSVLHQYLRRVNEVKEGIAYRMTSISAEELTRQTSHLWKKN